MTSVFFGDRPTGAIAALALKNTSEAQANRSPETSNIIIIKNSYVDDIIDSLVTVEKAERVTSEIDQILLKGGFRMKV
jgi:hypothetical protein